MNFAAWLDLANFLHFKDYEYNLGNYVYFYKKKIGFFSSFLVGISVVSIPSLLLCLGVSEMKSSQIIFPVGCTITMNDGNTATTITDMNANFGGTWVFDETDAIIDKSNFGYNWGGSWSETIKSYFTLFLYQRQSTVWFKLSTVSKGGTATDKDDPLFTLPTANDYYVIVDGFPYSNCLEINDERILAYGYTDGPVAIAKFSDIDAAGNWQNYEASN